MYSISLALLVVAGAVAVTDANLGRECCSGKYCAGYRGKRTITSTGKRCLFWTQEEREWFPTAGLNRNYCRNPDGEVKGPWCFTNNGWEFCGIKKKCPAFTTKVKLSCKRKKTNCERGGGKYKKLEYLDRQPVFCGKDEFLQKFRFKRCGRNVAKYVFDCCTPQKSEVKSSSCKRKATKCQLGGLGKYRALEYLDRQPVSCKTDGALQKFRFQRCNQNQAKYIFDCCTFKKSVKMSCKKKETKCARGGGKFWELEYLDRQRVFCDKDEVLQNFHFVRCKKANHAKYVFSCCTLLV